MGFVTLLAGAGGSGKTSLVQAMASCYSLRRGYLDSVAAERRVLMWAAEDDDDELWRRQVAIARWLGVPLSAFGSLYLHSYEGEECELAGLVHRQHKLVTTRMYDELCEQIGDYKADVLMIDNSARVFAGDENDRHQATSFVSLLTKAARPTRAAVMLLAHPGKAAGSEYSGSTAWEGAVRSRLYLGRTLPDAQPDDEQPDDESVRFLCRRKANYSPRDWHRLVYRDGVLVPDQLEATDAPRSSPLHARAAVTRAIRALEAMNEYGNASTSSPNYLPKLAKAYKLLEQTTPREFADAMRTMRKDGSIVVKVVGKYQNRTPREGLVLAAVDEVHK
jgi:RecA-family ATPase